MNREDLQQDAIRLIRRNPRVALLWATGLGYKSFTLADAEDWTSHMVNADGTKGPHWTLEQVKQIMAQRNIPGDPAQFWAAINMIYSDYCKAIQKTSANTLDFYVSITRAFLDDEDANPDKLKLYYEHIVKH